ncbi:unnamed protein product [Durusdinium trenchii]|uniref:Uncharacterized protein n=1 Tax=Durusdinium trenchii TaxID=1381693 RepID=A0ABP0LSP2_9DINO
MVSSVQPPARGFTAAAWTTFCWPPCGAGPGSPSRAVEADPAKEFETSSRSEISEVGMRSKDRRKISIDSEVADGLVQILCQAVTQGNLDGLNRVVLDMAKNL